MQEKPSKQQIIDAVQKAEFIYNYNMPEEYINMDLFSVLNHINCYRHIMSVRHAS